MSIAAHLKKSAAVIDAMIAAPSLPRVEQAVDVLVKALGANKPLLVCGNGGSASDSMHIAGELVGRFLKERRGLKCICLASDPAILTAWSNDYGYDTVFARQVEAYGEASGVVWGLSTSGNSKNVIAAFEKARSMNMTTIAMTGNGGGKLAALSDILIDVPSTHTPDIQQVHVCLYHYICETVEARLAP
jgi:D-sedoheptulose 7-phosphate isomerase